MKSLGIVLVTFSGGIGILIDLWQPGVIGWVGVGLAAVFTVGGFMITRD